MVCGIKWKYVLCNINRNIVGNVNVKPPSQSQIQGHKVIDLGVKGFISRVCTPNIINVSTSYGSKVMAKVKVF